MVRSLADRTFQLRFVWLYGEREWHLAAPRDLAEPRSAYQAEGSRPAPPDPRSTYQAEVAATAFRRGRGLRDGIARRVAFDHDTKSESQNTTT